MLNTMSRLPAVLYNILVYLAKQEEAEAIWKMMAYGEYDCLSRPNLTFAEKMNLVWKYGPQEKYNVFLTPLTEDAITESKTILKVYDYYIQPKTQYSSAVTIAFDFLYGGNQSLVEYDGVPVSRGDLFIHKALEVLNGSEIGGVGRLMFLDDLSRYSLARSTIGNSRTFTGVQLYMTVMIGDNGKGYDCGG